MINFQDVLNAGIGMVRASDEFVQKAVVEAQKNFEDLKNKGASDNSDTAIRARQVLADALRFAGIQS